MLCTGIPCGRGVDRCGHTSGGAAKLEDELRPVLSGQLSPPLGSGALWQQTGATLELRCGGDDPGPCGGAADGFLRMDSGLEEDGPGRCRSGAAPPPAEIKVAGGSAETEATSMAKAGHRREWRQRV